MAESRTLNTAIGWVLAVASIVFVALLFGVGSDALSNEPEADSQYVSDRAPTTAIDADATAGDQTTTSATATGGAGQLVVSEVGFTNKGWVRVANVGGSEASLAGHWLCNRPAYFEFPEMALQPGDSVIVAARQEVPELTSIAGGMPVLEAGGTIGFISDAGGEIGLYTSGSFSDSNSIISYVEWGEPDHGRSGTAVEAGIWVDGGFVESSGLTAIRATVDAPAAPGDWAGS